MRTKMILVVLALLSSILVAESLRPSPLDDSQLLEFAAASLNDQLAACDPSLEVDYTRVLERTDGNNNLLERGERQYRYIRTPMAMRIDTLIGEKVIHEAFHHRTTREYRAISTDLSELQGIQGYGLSEPFRNSEFLETGLYLLGGEPLVNWIPTAAVVATGEAVHGHDCLRLHIPSGVPRPCSFEVWLDPTIGYNPRRIDTVHASDRVTRIEFEDYQSITDRVFFPRKMTLQYSLAKQNWNIKVVNTVSRVAIGKAYTIDELRPVFPSGRNRGRAVKERLIVVPVVSGYPYPGTCLSTMSRYRDKGIPIQRELI